MATRIEKLTNRSGSAIWLKIRDGLVVAAMGCEPARFVGLTETQARRLARKVAS